MKVSKQSKEFLQNLRAYLIASGKKEQEIEEIISELEDHLVEAEKDGKNVEDIVGKTPKEYMEQIAKEMTLDIGGILKYIPIIFLGAFSYILLGDVIRGGLAYSVLQLVGYPIIFLFVLLVSTVAIKYLSSNKLSKVKEWTLYCLIGGIPMALFVGLLFLNDAIETPIFTFGPTINVIAAIFSIVVFIAIALWSKTWMPIVLPFILFVPEVIIGYTSLSEETKLILTALIIPVGLGLYFIVIWLLEKQKVANVVE
ncbi:DUF1129 family protein [Sutcliffiella cohnii]|uniref:DUF1129 family protein n=1 Tax=Sutcliffiella cohnii TaxID=33932 RepID=UPI002E237BF6|nr:DUF1129 family protein [Sutcliffiella cohnii]